MSIRQINTRAKGHKHAIVVKLFVHKIRIILVEVQQQYGHAGENLTNTVLDCGAIKRIIWGYAATTFG